MGGDGGGHYLKIILGSHQVYLSSLAEFNSQAVFLLKCVSCADPVRRTGQG